MKKLWIAALIIAVGFGLFLSHQFSRPLNISEPQFLIVESGEGLARLTTKLSRAGWLPLPSLLFRAYGRATASKGHIKEGEFKLNPGMTSVDLLALLRSGEVVQRTVTFPEGWTTAQWLTHLSNTPLLRENIDDQNGIGDLPLKEGHLYPDTYSYTRADSADDILQRARRKMEDVLAAAWLERSDSAEVTSIDEALVLASIIEKETGFGPDRPIIASVFNNRLARGMKLQSDPTVIYGLVEYSGDLRRSHLRIDHAYNTYVHRGLPAGPICNPGLASIYAALQPPASPYLYFVAQGDGRSYFSTSLEEHNDAVNRFQKAGRVEQYRSAPTTEPN